jgi:hypothetical protein
MNTFKKIALMAVFAVGMAPTAQAAITGLEIAGIVTAVTGLGGGAVVNHLEGKKLTRGVKQSRTVRTLARVAMVAGGLAGVATAGRAYYDRRGAAETPNVATAGGSAGTTVAVPAT